MFKEESIWIREILKNLDSSEINNVLDVGSSTLEFRTQTQPHIDKNVFGPLRDKGTSISYMDKKSGEGIDYVSDIESMSADRMEKKFSLVICCSLLEHIKNPEKTCSLLVALVKPGGFLLVTVPRSYRYHPDPIDTMFRPSMKQLISMFSGMEILSKRVVHIKDKKRYRLSGISEVFRYIIPLFNWKVNCLFMRKRE